MRKRDSLVFLKLAFVDELVVPDAEYSFVDLEDELGLGGVVHCHSWPHGVPFFVIKERTGEDAFEFLRDGGALDHFRKSGGVYVMFDDDSVFFPVFIDETEPFLNALEKFYPFSEAFELAPFQAYSCFLGFVEHQLHVAEDVAGILACGDLVAHSPELRRAFADRLYEAELLHVPRRQRAVEVIYQGDYRFLFHLCSENKSFNFKQ